MQWWIIVFEKMLKSYAERCSFHSGTQRLNVLTYHRVSENFSPLKSGDLSLERFKEQLFWLKKYFVVLSLPEALDLKEKKSLPKRAVTITVDDGYQDSYSLIYKSLVNEGLSASFFITTDGLKTGFLWDELLSMSILNAPTELEYLNLSGKKYDISTFRKKESTYYYLTEVAKYLPLTKRDSLISDIVNQVGRPDIGYVFLKEKEIREMNENGMVIGAHTHHHPILIQESDDIAFHQISESKSILEKIIENKVEYFAYPNGKYQKDFDDNHIEMIKKLGFKAAFSTNWGALSDLDSDRYRINRFTPWDDSELKFCFRLASNYRRC